MARELRNTDQGYAYHHMSAADLMNAANTMPMFNEPISVFWKTFHQTRNADIQGWNYGDTACKIRIRRLTVKVKTCGHCWQRMIVNHGCYDTWGCGSICMGMATTWWLQHALTLQTGLEIIPVSVMARKLRNTSQGYAYHHKSATGPINAANIMPRRTDFCVLASMLTRMVLKMSHSKGLNKNACGSKNTKHKRLQWGTYRVKLDSTNSTSNMFHNCLDWPIPFEIEDHPKVVHLKENGGMPTMQSIYRRWN